MASAEGDHLEAVVPRLEGAGHRRRDPDCVERLHLDHLVVEFHPAAAPDDDVDLLRLVVVVTERLAFVRLQAVIAEAGVLGLDVLPGETGLHRVAVAEVRRRILDLGQLLMGEGIAHLVLSVAGRKEATRAQ